MSFENKDYDIVEQIKDEDLEANLRSNDVQLVVNTILSILDKPKNVSDEKKQLSRKPHVRWVVELIKAGNSLNTEDILKRNPNVVCDLKPHSLNIPEHLHRKCFYFSDFKHEHDDNYSAIKKIFKHSLKYHYFPSFESINLVDNISRVFVKCDEFWYLIEQEDFDKFFQPIEEHRLDLIDNIIEEDGAQV